MRARTRSRCKKKYMINCSEEKAKRIGCDTQIVFVEIVKDSEKN